MRLGLHHTCERVQLPYGVRHCAKHCCGAAEGVVPLRAAPRAAQGKAGHQDGGLPGATP